MFFGSFFSIVKIKCYNSFKNQICKCKVSLNLFYTFSDKYTMDKMDHSAYTVILLDIFQVFQIYNSI